MNSANDNSAPLRAPFPWQGGKSRASALVWEALGNPAVYVEPFAGSLAVLLNRVEQPRCEIANDLDGMICNFFRCLASVPNELAIACDLPVHELDLTARRRSIVGRREELTTALHTDPSYFNLEVAAWWVHGVCATIGGHDYGNRISKQLPNLARATSGVLRLSWGCDGFNEPMAFHNIREWFQALAKRLHHVRFACGDWERVARPSVWEGALSSYASGDCAGVFLDPPYVRGTGYLEHDSTLRTRLLEWATAHGNHPRLRIVLAGENDEYNLPGWSVVEWKRKGGWGDAQNENKTRHLERLWLSPNCQDARQLALWSSAQ